MSDRRAEDASIAPRRSLSGSGTDGPVLPPMPKPSGRNRKARAAREPKAHRIREVKPASPSPSSPAASTPASTPASSRAAEDWQARRAAPSRTKAARPVGQTRRARLRITQVDPWSVTKTAFLLSIALGVVSIVAVAIVWTVLGASGLWDSINSTIQQTLGDSTGKPFEIQDYLGTSRVLGFTMIVAVVDVVLITMIATLGAFLYNLAATLLGGVEVTLTEDD